MGDLFEANFFELEARLGSSRKLESRLLRDVSVSKREERTRFEPVSAEINEIIEVKVVKSLQQGEFFIRCVNQCWVKQSVRLHIRITQVEVRIVLLHFVFHLLEFVFTRLQVYLVQSFKSLFNKRTEGVVVAAPLELIVILEQTHLEIKPGLLGHVFELIQLFIHYRVPNLCENSSLNRVPKAGVGCVDFNCENGFGLFESVVFLVPNFQISLRVNFLRQF